MTNAERIQRAHETMLDYMAKIGDDSMRDVLIDLLTDLRHWAKSKKISFAKANDMAEVNYEEEK